MVGAGHQQGFTLIEMLVVLTIVAIVGAAAIGRISSAPHATDRQRAIGEARIVLADARAQAVATGSPIITPKSSGTAARPLAFAGPGKSGLIFYPDGSSSGGTVTLAGQPILTVDWLSGAIGDA